MKPKSLIPELLLLGITLFFFGSVMLFLSVNELRYQAVQASFPFPQP